MKNTFGMTAALCLAIFLLASSSTLGAKSPDIDIIWGGTDPGYETWTVISATGGHMKDGDTFTVARNINGKGIKLKPAPLLRTKWSDTVDFPLTIEGTAGDSALCGFVVLDTPEHSGMAYGHGQQHGILLKVQQPGRIKIIWSALPLAKGNLKDKNTRSKKCKELEKLYHGGIAHAKN